MYVPSVNFRLICGEFVVGSDMVTEGTANDEDGLGSLSLCCFVNISGLGERSTVFMIAS